MNTDIIYRLYQDAYNEEMMPFLKMKNGTPLFVFETTDNMEGKIRKKFAELIVRECAEICLEANDHKNILRHFGIE